MLIFFAHSSGIRREMDASACFLYQAPQGIVRQVVGSCEIPEFVCGEKDGLTWWAGLPSAGAHQ